MTKWDGIAPVDCICSIFVTALYAPVECTNSYMNDLRCVVCFSYCTQCYAVEKSSRKKQEVGYVLLDLRSAQQQVEPRVS